MIVSCAGAYSLSMYSVLLGDGEGGRGFVLGFCFGFHLYRFWRLTDIGNLPDKACYDLYILSPFQVGLFFPLSLYLNCFKVEQFGKKNKGTNTTFF